MSDPPGAGEDPALTCAAMRVGRPHALQKKNFFKFNFCCVVEEDVVGVLKKYFACLTRVHVCAFVLSIH